jgi:tetratricopeptide (TPR) repeat protein
MLRLLRQLLSRRPRTPLLILLVLLGTGAGLYGYALHQWSVAGAVVKDRPADAQRSLKLCLWLLWPRSTEVKLHLLAARAARLRGDFDGAEAHLQRCMKLQNGASDATQLEFLLMRVQAGQVDEVATALFNCVADKHPESPLILETIAQAYMHNHRYRPALACLNLWIKEQPESASAHHWRGWVLERLNNLAGAMKDYERALELDPGLIVLRLRVVEILLERGSVPEALPHLEHLQKQCPDRPEVLARLGQCRFAQGRHEEARRLLEAAVEQLPNDPVLLICLAKLDNLEGRPVRAERWLRRVLDADPTDTEARYQLVGSLRLQGREKEARAALVQHEKDKAQLKRANQLLKDEADYPTSGPVAPYEIGALFLRLGQRRLGLYWLHQALERDPSHQPTHRLLAEYYEKKGERDKAEAHRRRLTQAERKPKRQTARP